MSNIFLDSNQYVPTLKRNAFDKQKLVNGTYRCGYIYPVDWEEVTFGDSIKLDISSAIRTMPMVWPIQTPIITKFYTFYVPFRILMDNFKDFRFNNKSIVHPYISLPSDADFWKTGELGDHLGIPTTYASDHNLYALDLFSPNLDDSVVVNLPIAYLNSTPNFVTHFLPHFSYTNTAEVPNPCRFISNPITKSIVETQSLHLKPNFIKTDAGTGQLVLYIYTINESLGLRTSSLVAYSSFNVTASESGIDLNLATATFTTSDSTYSGFKALVQSLNPKYTMQNYYFCIRDRSQNLDTPTTILDTDTFSLINRSNYIQYDTGSGVVELSEVANPFSGVSPEIPLSALVPRAYEACYRSYFQDLINEPFIIDGEAQYNRYNTTTGDGADSTDYKLFRRNWEADPFTSCKPSPQQGLAPIVGLTSSGDITLERADGGEYRVRLTTDDNDVITGYAVRAPNQQSDSQVRRTLLELSTTGFTINALRNGNAFQQWVEANYRRGMKFPDQVLSNFGVKLKHHEIDMPIFLGGFSVPLDVNVVNQTSASVEGNPLGDIAGNGGFYGKAKHSISHYCDEEGIVMTLMCITPIPVYSQMLNKAWLKSNPLDYYNPQFGMIGNQPVTFEEVCPVQAYNEGVDVHDVFGYQRPWYWKISSFDEVHGAMRNSMSGFVMQRIFGSTPELGASFLHIDEQQMNEVFVVQDGEQDTFYGQILINKKVKAAVPRLNVPSLVG